MRDPRPPDRSSVGRSVDIRLRELDRKLPPHGPDGPDGAPGANGVLGAPGKFNLFTSGRWYVQVASKISTQASPVGWPFFGAPAQGHITATPFYVSQPITLDAVGTRVDLAYPATLIRFGVYSDTGLGAPGALGADWGQLDCSTLGSKILVVSHTLGAGLHWLAAVDQGPGDPAHPDRRSYLKCNSESWTSVGTLTPPHSPPYPPGTRIDTGMMLDGVAGYVSDAAVATTGLLPSSYPAAYDSTRFVPQIAVHVA